MKSCRMIQKEYIKCLKISSDLREVLAKKIIMASPAIEQAFRVNETNSKDSYRLSTLWKRFLPSFKNNFNLLLNLLPVSCDVCKPLTIF